MSDRPEPTYSLQTAIELACAAERANKGYVKENDVIFVNPNKPQEIHHSNKELILVAIGAIDPKKYEDLPNKPVLLCTNLDDRERATEMRKFFKRLLFTAIEGDDQFKSDLYTILEKEEVAKNKMGFIAYLPFAYQKEKYRSAIKKAVPEHLGYVGEELLDLDCEIIRCTRSKNYDAWNTDAIIDSRLVSWMGKHQLKLGPCVLVKGKVKDHSAHWQHPEINVTRLNYVRAFQ
jgi:hypothetical protein